MARRNPCSPGAARRPICGTPQMRATRSRARLFSFVHFWRSHRRNLGLSRDTFEPKGAGLVVLRHHPQPLCSIRMRNLARDASTQGGMIQ